eukprot:3492975-Heterocapsa_arctica.AAC.1
MVFLQRTKVCWYGITGMLSHAAKVQAADDLARKEQRPLPKRPAPPPPRRRRGQSQVRNQSAPYYF